MLSSSAPIGVSNGSLVGLTAEEDWCIVPTGVGFSVSVATMDGSLLSRGLHLVPGVFRFGAGFKQDDVLSLFEVRGTGIMDCFFVVTGL
jgi:hypothetical protein